jgi:beta-lactamase regulating signal transducer with metallopeptidase domain
MNFINQSAFLKALGWSLLDSLWQMGLMWVVYVCLTANGKKFQARQRHTVALLSLTGGTLWFFITLVINFYKAAAAPEIVTVYLSTGDTATQQSLLAQIAAYCEPALPYLSVAYLGIACILFFRLYLQYYHTRQLCATGIQKAHPEWRVFLQQAVQHMGIKKKVTIWFSSLVDTPLTLGFWKPVILLPVAAVNHLSIQQAEAIILHELNHISRNDYLVNLLIACTDIILFFNPFTRFLSGIIRKEREHSCDDMVLQFRYDPTVYAKALLTLEQNRCGTTSSLAMAATGKNQQFLLNRVKRILRRENTNAPVSQKMIAFLLSALLIGFIGLYNPGKIITRTIDDVNTPVASTESIQLFETPPTNVIAANEASPAPDAKDENAEEKNEKEAAEEANDITQLEDLIELAADVKLAAIADKLEEYPEMASFANAWQTIDFAFQQPEEAAVPAEAKTQIYPYVPSSSFSYQVMEDTALPKKYIMTFTEQKTKEAVEKALVALQVLDWKKLEKEINSGPNKVDIIKLQKDLEKALREVDWKKVDEEAQAALLAEEDLVKQQEAYRIQLGNYQQDRARKQEKIKQAQQQVLLDRLAQHEKLKSAEVEKTTSGSCNSNSIRTTTAPKAKTTTKKVKKIVHI